MKNDREQRTGKYYSGWILLVIILFLNGMKICGMDLIIIQCYLGGRESTVDCIIRLERRFRSLGTQSILEDKINEDKQNVF